MNTALRFALCGWCLWLCLGTNGVAAAESARASREADRQAKAAAPSANEAFIYVYRAGGRDGDPIAVTVGGDTFHLAPGTFAWWKVKPGRAEVAVPGGKGAAVPVAGGRVYYFEVRRGSGGVPVLRAVSFPQGRAEVQRSQLVARKQIAPAPPAAPARPEQPAPRPAAPRKHYPSSAGAITLKLGAFAMADDAQTIVAAQRVFDDSASSVFALEGEWFVRPDISLGLELLRYANEYTTPSGVGPGETETTAILFNAKRYFFPASAWQPYAGVGAGAAMTDSTGGGVNSFVGETSGLALQLLGGVQWRHDRFALRAEYRYLSADTEDDGGEEIDVSGSGFFLGVSVFF